MAGELFRYRAIRVFIGAEDHPPPHVHVEHIGDGWRARFRFSFLSDVAALYRFKPRGARPTLSLLNEVADMIVENLADCRSEWWATHGERHGIGLVNRRVETRITVGGDNVMARVALRPGRNAIEIKAARYEPTHGKVTLELANGQQHHLTAGKHIEEAEEW